MIIYGKEKEVLNAQKRSLAAWINNTIGSTLVNADNLMSKLSTGVVLCKLAKCIQTKADEFNECHRKAKCHLQLKFWERAKKETFFARDNAEMFIQWCKSFGVRDPVLFESDGLVLQTQPRNVVLCLLELARLASKYGILLPPPIQLPKASSIMVEQDDVSDCSDDDFFFTTSIKSPSKLQRLDSGCSSATRSPSPASIYSKTSSPLSSLKRSGIPLRKMDKNVLVMVKNHYNNRLLPREDGSQKSLLRSPSPAMRRSASLAKTDTISTRMRYKGVMNGSYSSLPQSKGLPEKKLRSANPIIKQSFGNQKGSILDQRVLEISRQFLKEETKMSRISEGRYSFNGKNVFLRIVRGNNVVVRLGGGWDTLEHFLTTLDKTHCTKWSQPKNYNEQKQALPVKRTCSFATL